MKYNNIVQVLLVIELYYISNVGILYRVIAKPWSLVIV